MKKFLIYALGIIATLSSCNSMLEKEPLDELVNNTEFWNDPNNIKGYANGFYTQFSGYGEGSAGGEFYFNTLSDDQAGSGFTNWNYINVPASDGNWNSGWAEVRHANFMIQGIENSNLDQTTKEQWLGVARLMRAFQYFNLIRKYGDLFWIDKPLNIDDLSLLYTQRSDRDVIMDKVLDDLNFATSHIEENNTSKTTWSRSMANALKADICLWEGTYRKYRSETDGQKAADIEGAKKYLTACVDACKYIMDQGYSLSDDYQSLYNSIDLKNNPEVIFYKVYKKDLLTHSLISWTSSSSVIYGMTKDAFDAYLFTDGKPLALTTKQKTDVGINVNGHISIAEQLSVRDKRLSETIDPIVFYAGNSWARTSDGQLMTSSTGYGVRKFDNTTLSLNDRKNNNYTSAPIYWLAIIYLDYAEAKAELGNITDADLDLTINKLKDRAGLPHISQENLFHDPANNMGVSDLIWEIRRERRCELMFDKNYRYWDLIRWHQLDKLDSGQHPDILLGANIKNDAKATIKKTGDYIDASMGMTRVYDKKHYFYPIPQDQLTLNANMKQNPGW